MLVAEDNFEPGCYIFNYNNGDAFIFAYNTGTIRIYKLDEAWWGAVCL
jgi:hypothetical protein